MRVVARIFKRVVDDRWRLNSDTVRTLISAKIAIKYNKQFADPYWNSSQVSFGRHLWDLMTSWAVVADVYYLEPQEMQEGETATQFAQRVKNLICEKADLIAVNWDGFLKRNRISPKFMAQRQKSLAEVSTPAQLRSELARRTWHGADVAHVGRHRCSCGA